MKNNQLKVSVIIPTFNSEKFITNAITSVQHQTYSNWEIIVIDNNSSDNTIAKVEAYSDKNIKIYKINNNGIIGKSRNLGIEKASGSWIAFLDSDDYWEDNKLERLYNVIKTVPDVDFLFHDEYIVNEEELKVGVVNSFHHFSLNHTNLLMYGNCISTSTVLVKKSFLNINQLSFSVDLKYVTVEDYELWLQCLYKNAKMYYLNQNLGYSKIHGNNESNNVTKLIGNLVNVYQRHICLVVDENVSKTVTQMFFCKIKLMYGQSFFRKKRYLSGSICIIKALMQSPVSFIKHVLFYISKTFRYNFTNILIVRS